VKARAVKGVDPRGSTADGLERIIRVRVDELFSFTPAVLDPAEVEALHDMRIAAKRLRYLLEVSAPFFGPYAERATAHTKELQDRLGEIHDCDVMLPRVLEHTADLRARDATAVVALAADADELEPRLSARSPSRAAHRGLGVLAVHLQARRALLHARFSAEWQALQRKGFRARLEWALAERGGDVQELSA
jgi:hypothetical protein